MNQTLISIITPMHNESENVDVFLNRIEQVAAPLDVSIELICIDDGSHDDTWERLTRYVSAHTKLRLIKLSRNFGKEAALAAGIDYANGDAIIPIDADLQDPPELIADLIREWQQGHDVVYAVRSKRDKDSFLKRSSAGWFYHVFNKMSSVKIPFNAGDFRIIDRRVVDTLKQLPEHSRFMKGLYSWVGFKQTSVEFERQARHKGDTKWNYWKLWNYALDGITSFSTTPLKIWLYFGSMIALLSFLYASYLIIKVLVFGIHVPGYASIMVSILFFGGIQLMTLGFIGEYIGRIYEEVKRRPIYIIDQLKNLSKK